MTLKKLTLAEAELEVREAEKDVELATHPMDLAWAKIRREHAYEMLATFQDEIDRRNKRHDER